MNSSSPSPPNDGLLIDELLAGRALGDLTDDESETLHDLLVRYPERETDEFENVAAAVAFLNPPAEHMPAQIRKNIQRDARDYFPTTLPASSTARRVNPREFFAWSIAAVCLVFALFQLVPESKTVAPIVSQRDALIRTADDLVELAWAPGLHPFKNEVGGDVVWSNERQRGFLRFSNMPVNDPEIEQYQLWIIDPDRDKNPIDGGVFDISDTGEVIIPINAKLGVVNPQAFAITIEKPGGVVVSAQDRLPLLAKVGT